MFLKLLVVALLCFCASCFPDGAPIDACVKDRANQPNHGRHRSKPLSTSPYRVTASAVNYAPEDRITDIGVRSPHTYVCKHVAVNTADTPRVYREGHKRKVESLIFDGLTVGELCFGTNEPARPEKYHGLTENYVSPISISGAIPFKGFFIQARSVETDEWLGGWEDTPNTTIHPECAAITHADPRNKTRATFLWRAPSNHGRVYFTGTVLKDYGTFWANLIAEAPLDQTALQILG